VINRKVIPQMIPLHLHKGFDQDKHEGKDEHHDQVQEESNDQQRDEDDGDNGETPPHPKVCHNVQRDHLVNNILGDIEKGVTTRSHIANFLNIICLFLFLSISRLKMHYMIQIGWWLCKKS
jgi:TATA-binding protein-associated factor Taf7